MIGYLSGRVLEVSEGRVWVGVGGEAGTVGYVVHVPAQVQYLEIVPGQKVEVFVHTHVREDALDLYGFLTSTEKELFLTLLQVSGIGPKGALSILSRAMPDQVVQAVVERDREALIKLPGIGKKTAERIVVELADAIQKKSEVPGSWVTQLLQSQKSATSENRILRDAREALVSLGYSEVRVSQVIKQLQGTSIAHDSVEVLIRSALKALGTGL